MPRHKEGFYEQTPEVPASKISDDSLVFDSNLANDTPKMVPKNPGKSSGFGGPVQAEGHRPKSSGYGHSVINRLGKMRLSGHSGAHRIGKRGI